MRQTVFKYSGKFLESLALSSIVFFSSASHGAQPRNLDIAQTPLFLGFTVQPNVFFVTDDSGSMDQTFLTQAHWRWYHYDPDPIRDGSFDSETPTVTRLVTRVTNPNTNPPTTVTAPETATITSRLANGLFHSAWFDSTTNTSTNTGRYRYVYGNNDNVATNNCEERGMIEECGNTLLTPLDVDWRGRVNDLNKVFYSTGIFYEPWDGPCDTNDNPCENAVFIGALSNPYSTQDGFGITRNLAVNGDVNGGPFIYEVWIDDSGYGDDIPKRGEIDPGEPGTGFNETGYASTEFSTDETKDVSNGEVDLWDSHMQFSVSSTSIDVSLIAYNPEPTGANRGLNETRLGGGTTLSATGGACYKVLGSKASVKAVRDVIISNPTPTQAGIAIAATGTPSDPGVAGGPECRTVAEVTQNIANWYQYYRRRAYPVKNAIAEVMDAQPSFRFGLTVLNNFDPSKNYERGTGNSAVPLGKGLFVPLPAIDEGLAVHNERIKKDYFSFKQPRRGTPLRNALQRAGEYYKGGTKFSNTFDFQDPIIYPCQKNFTILLTDGFWNGNSPAVGDQDGDTRSNTLADVAYKYYIEDLNINIGNDVPLELPVESDLLDKTGTTKPKGPTFQHMVTFTVAFGVTGNLLDTDSNGRPDGTIGGSTFAEPAKNDPNWGDPATSQVRKIDDLWHAAYNSGGVFASASTPTEITRKLLGAISAVAARLGSASAVALNSGTLNANSRLYLARFDSQGWSGNVFSVPIQDGFVDLVPPTGDDSPPECLGFAVGELCDPEWNAGLQLARDYTVRKIFTMNTDSRALVAFDWGALSGAQKESLRVDPDAPAAAVPVLEPVDRGKARLEYIKGDHTQEIDVGGAFRTRAEVSNLEDTQKLNVKNRLGDIIHSSPAFVGAPDFFYPESIETDSYAAFKLKNRTRTGMVYVGSNDGMLHGFNATTGDEVFAYVPGILVNSLNKLTAPSYNSQHQYYVDGAPVVFDAYKGTWKTMLAASLGAGVQGVYGLEITDPTTFGTGTNKVAWEFTDDPLKKGDEDLGYITGDVSFAKMNNGRWAVIFGNGYNNTADDGNKSATGNGVIYIVDAFSGELIKKIDTGIGWEDDPTGTAVNGVFSSNERPNGIASVTAVDMDGDFKADYLYAGDLFGNLWKVDVTSTSESSWQIAYSGVPFFIAKDATTAPPYPDGKMQPITSGVAVKRHPVNREQVLVLFGTGKYIEISDAVSATESSDIETFYSIWDDGRGQAGRGKLLKQEILAQVEVDQLGGGKAEFRITSSALETPNLYAINWEPGQEGHRGWYMDLRLDGVAEYGEEVVITPLVRNNRVVFITQTPNGTGTCSAGGTSWLMELNVNDGSRLPDAPFDVDGNGIINDKDVASFGADKITSGVRLKEGISAGGGVLSSRNSSTERKYLSGSTSKTNNILESATAEYRKRQSWRQLR
ncbi:Type IV fimbrial biogenesis protein PilY1 [hydrothermal vent metagenome]|uniref:Type IV fimbrial biogenesis protein PilY1 n=1 Tax=hydrothermal vent metagenome TaxID=652676 RepID=A0A3B0XYY3_9ZZZZ